MNLKKLIEANLYIYKENVKLIINSCVDNICLFQTDSPRLDNRILKELNKGQIAEIKEVDEEEGVSELFNSNSNSCVGLSDQLAEFVSEPERRKFALR